MSSASIGVDGVVWVDGVMAKLGRSSTVRWWLWAVLSLGVLLDRGSIYGRGRVETIRGLKEG